ncbi:MAG: FkbM family methyltransferase [Elusimicrobia bacterium]|nr:FkbM family methyltransferase [Elusimicrobiota bacterium]
MLAALKKVFDAAFDAVLSEDRQVRFAMHVLNRLNGDDNYDPRTNGEYWVLGKIKERHAGPDLVIFDVGAHVGEWTLRAAHGLAPGARVFSFEPTSASRARLKESVEKGGVAKIVTIVDAALSDQDGAGSVFIDGDLCGTNSVYRQGYAEKWRDVNAEKKVESVRLVKGDTFCAERKLDRVHFVKIDAEAHEVNILRGFERMLTERRIDVLQFEYSHGWINARHFLHEAWSYLEGKGYTIGKLRGNGAFYPERYKTAYEKFEACNYLALKPGAERL